MAREAMTQPYVLQIYEKKIMKKPSDKIICGMCGESVEKMVCIRMKNKYFECSVFVVFHCWKISRKKASTSIENKLLMLMKPVHSWLMEFILKIVMR